MTTYSLYHKNTSSDKNLLKKGDLHMVKMFTQLAAVTASLLLLLKWKHNRQKRLVAIPVRNRY